jgi:hypothetical protein
MVYYKFRPDKKLTKSSVVTLKPSETNYIALVDGLAGFGIRVIPSGAKTFILKYRVGKGRTAPYPQADPG